MITIFRRVRETLIRTGKVKSYLFYSVGEILLVMIGILLALQVNNWNESRKVESQELSLLFEINENLNQSKLDIDRMVSSNMNRINSYYTILTHMDDNKAYHDSLNHHFRYINTWTSPYLTFTAYETLKQKGIDIIQNDSLRKSITNMYESQFAYLIEDWDRSEWLYNESVVTPFFSQNFYISLNPFEEVNGLAIPNDYEALIRDPQFKNILTRVIAVRSNGNAMGRRISENLTKLISDIDKELQSRGFVIPNS